MNSGQQAERVRAGAGLFRRSDRGVVLVRGGDRVRWLQGMLSNDVVALEAGPTASGCTAALLNHRAGVVADFQVALRPDAFWLECERSVLPEVIERLGKFIVADDVELLDGSDRLDLLGLEGPRAGDWLAAALGAAEPPALAANAVGEIALAGETAVLGAWGSSGESAYRLVVPAGTGEAVCRALGAAKGPGELVEADAQALEILRIEAGVPRMGFELGEDVLPDEARLEAAVSDTKGCYTGQEIIARLRSRGRVNHLLVGLRFTGAAPAALEAKLRTPEREVGEVTSACVSPSEGAIGLGFVRREHASPGTQLGAAGESVTVAALPFLPAAR